MTYKWLRNLTVLSFLLSGLMGYCIYHIKHRVIDLKGNLHTVNKDIICANESLHILKAEWGYLNQPQRLKQLNDEHLNLTPITYTQVASIKTAPAVFAARPKTKGANRVIVS